MTIHTYGELDEVLVTARPYLGGVGLVGRVNGEGSMFVEGTTPAGETFSRWYAPAEITPAVWGTWYVQVTMASGAVITSRDLSDAPIETPAMWAERIHATSWFAIEVGLDDEVPGGVVHKALATAHVESIDIIVHDRRDAR